MINVCSRGSITLFRKSPVRLIIVMYTEYKTHNDV